VLEEGVAKRARRHPLGEKVVDETILLKRPRRGARLREEVWQTDDGKVTKYNLAYMTTAGRIPFSTRSTRIVEKRR
jgi:hypothetical protein